MSIRTYNKLHVKESATLVVAPAPKFPGESDNDPLRFWTTHPTHPCLVNLHVFRDGWQGRRGRSNGASTGRPELIRQLAPVIRADLDQCSQVTVRRVIAGMRAWWRLFDTVEAAVPMGGEQTLTVKAISDISEIHRQCASDWQMHKSTFNNFLRILNLTRVAFKLPRLHWRAPEGEIPRRHLPPQWQINEIRFALKHGWRAVLHRWETLPNVPSCEASKDGFYPDADDARMAFHLCLAGTGWNPSVLLSIDIHSNFLETHPKDPSRYLLRGFKARGKSEQIIEGLFKSRESAGIVITALVKRTMPLRDHMYAELAEREVEYDSLRVKPMPQAELDRKMAEIVRLREGCRSPWLFMSKQGVCFLHGENYSFTGWPRSNTFLGTLVAGLNEGRSPEKCISTLKPSDFRDAFAEYAYRVSGGMVLYVMQVLGHKNPRTTQEYLDNTVLNDERNKLYSIFSNALWEEIEANHRVDPTILAKVSRDGVVSEEERNRLSDYRALRRSRLGVGCKDPTHPPKSIAPDFEPDGKAVCLVQRCTLCPENAVIFPESLPGLCKRTVELRFLELRMSAVAFAESTFSTELKNTEFVLQHFDPNEVELQLTGWEQRIENGDHRVIEFEGAKSNEGCSFARSIDPV